MAATCNNETIRFDQKQTIAAFERQVQNLQQLLSLQTNETEHCQEHILILNREIDALRKIVEEKQKSIHDLQKQLRQKKEFATDLEKKYDESKIDRLAFFELEERNLQLLGGLKEQQAEIERLQVENRYLQEHREDRLLLEELKAKKALELEISFPYERTQLQVRLDQAHEVNNQQAIRLQLLESQVQALTQDLQSHQEHMKDMLLRSKQSEYKMLMELDAKDVENHALDVQHHQMKTLQQSLAAQTGELTAQLNNSIQQTETLQTLFSSTIHTLENDVHQLHTKEKLLRRENQLLQYEGQVQQGMIARASTALLESGALPRKKDKKNPLSLTATLPLVATTAASTASKERPLSAMPQGPKAKPSDTSQRASSSQKSKSKRNPLQKFAEPSSSSRSGSAAGAPGSSPDQSRSRLHTAVPTYQLPAVSQSPLADRNSTPLTVIDPVLSAFSPAATGQLRASTAESVESAAAGDSAFIAALRQSALSPTSSSSQRLPQHDIAAMDLKNTMLHRFMQLVCRCYEAVAAVEKLLGDQRSSTLRKSGGYADGMQLSMFSNDSEDRVGAVARTSTGSFWNTPSDGANPFVALGVVEVLNLNNCSLVDADLNAVIDWLRTIPPASLLAHLQSISLQHNALSGDALVKLFTWASSLSMDDWRHVTSRGVPLEIDLKHNSIAYEAIAEAVKHMRRLGNPDFAHIALLEAEKERKILFHVRSRTHKSGSCVAMVMDVNKQRGDHRHRLLRNSLAATQQQKEQQLEAQFQAAQLSFRDPLVSKIQTFTTESIYPILQTAGLIASSQAASFSPLRAASLSLDEDDVEQKEAATIPRDLIMKYDFVR
eukprot:gene2942-2150_t